MNEQYSTPDSYREWELVDFWQDDDPRLLAEAVQAEANYCAAQQEDMSCL